MHVKNRKYQLFDSAKCQASLKIHQIHKIQWNATSDMGVYVWKFIIEAAYFHQILNIQSKSNGNQRAGILRDAHIHKTAHRQQNKDGYFIGFNV